MHRIEGTDKADFHVIAGLRGVITGDGVWRVRRRPRSPVIEVYKVEETGHGKIVTDELINWRIRLSLSQAKQLS